MANNPKLCVASRNAALDAALDVLNSGSILVLDGTQATDADTAIGAQVTLAQLTFGSTAFAAASSGSKVANAITQDSAADATGTASWCRLRNSSNVAKWDLSAGTSGCDVNFNTVAIQINAAVAITSLTASMAA